MLGVGLGAYLQWLESDAINCTLLPRDQRQELQSPMFVSERVARGVTPAFSRATEIDSPRL